MDTRIPEGRVEYEQWIKQKKYLTVTTISMHHMRYMIPLDQLDELNNGDIESFVEACISGENQEMSQFHIAENEMTADHISEEKMLEYFDEENPYLASWSKDQKINFVRNLNKKL